MAAYIAVIHKEPKSDFGVSFPDFPGCITAAATLDQAKDLAQEALALHIKGMLEDGAAIPEPSTLEAIKALPEVSDAAAFLIVSAPESKTVRINITVPSHVLREIDNAARASGLSRSAFMVRATKNLINQHV